MKIMILEGSSKRTDQILESLSSQDLYLLAPPIKTIESLRESLIALTQLPPLEPKLLQIPNPNPLPDTTSKNYIPPQKRFYNPNLLKPNNAKALYDKRR